MTPLYFRLLPAGCRGLVAWICLLVGSAQGAAVPESGEVTVRGNFENAVGTTDTASAGVINAAALEDRPIQRPGEVLELVPGMVVTQHSGSGKANQYFLRGYNLDHGTDFASFLNGMPVNLPTHAHGQGYSDLNLLIPELVDHVDFRKGPYYAEEGDFASTGAAHIEYVDRLPGPLASFTVGNHRFGRTLVAASPSLAAGNLLLAVEAQHANGPWENPENLRKYNGVLRYSEGDAQRGFNVTGMAYEARWNSNDQIPLRAVQQGLISPFGQIDPTDGGNTQRYSLSYQGRTPLTGLPNLQASLDAFVINYQLDLFNNFDYFLRDQVNGDQFHQQDRRTVLGLRPTLSWGGRLGSLEVTHRVGVQTRFDDIRVGLYDTQARQLLTLVRQDQVKEGSAAVFYENSVQWTPWLRSVLGARLDRYRFRVNDLAISANSGQRSAGMGSPKFSVIFGPWRHTELFANAGYGFHSNDARGTVIQTDPNTLAPVDPVTPLVRTRGAELGLKSEAVPGLQSSLACFIMTQDSELLFTGDAGTTEPSFPSRRTGVEWINIFRPLPWLFINAELSATKARFTGNDPAGDRIPNSVPLVAELGAGVKDLGRWSASGQLRYFSPGPLVEDNRVRSRASSIVNLRAGYRLDHGWNLHLDVLNLFNNKPWNIAYYYASCLRSDPASAGCNLGLGANSGVNDIHFHPAEPRQIRVTLALRF